MISKFYCLTGISPKDNSQFESLHHGVGEQREDPVELPEADINFGSKHIKSKSEFNSKFERTSDLFLLVCFGLFSNTGLQTSLSTPLHLLSLSVTSFVLIIFDQSVVVSLKQVGRRIVP